MKQHHSQFKIFFFVLFMISIYAASYDMYSASLPVLEHYFNVPSNAIQITMTVYAAASLIGTIPIGIFNDILGRKKCALSLLILVASGSLLCLFAPNLKLFYLGRALQGMGGSGLYVVAISIPKDMLQGKEFIATWQWLTLAFYIAPSLATALGGYIVYLFNWQTVFIVILMLCFMLFLCLLLFFQDTGVKRTSLNKKNIFDNYKTVLRCKKFLSYSYITALAWAGMGVFYLFLPFIIVNQLHYSTVFFGWVSFSMVMAGVLGRLLNMFLFSRYLSMKQTTWLFCILNVVAALLVLVAVGVPNTLMIYILVPATILFGFSASISSITGSSIAFSIFDQHLSASAAAVYGLMIDLIITFSLLISACLSTSVLMLGFVILGLSISALLLLCINFE